MTEMENIRRQPQSSRPGSDRSRTLRRATRIDRSLPPLRVLGMPWKIVGSTSPRGFRVAEYSRFRLLRRMIVQRSRWNDNRLAAPAKPRHGASALAAEPPGEARRGRQIKVPNGVFPSEPRELSRRQVDVGRVRCPRCLPAPPAVAVSELRKRRVHFVRHLAAEAATAQVPVRHRRALVFQGLTFGLHSPSRLRNSRCSICRRSSERW